MPESINPFNQLERFASRLDWNLLRTYVVIVQERSITNAAERLCLQQPTVSAALKRLESTLEYQLISRGRGHFELTMAGQKLYEEAMSIYRTVSRLNEWVSDPEEDILGHVRIITISHVVSDRLDKALRQFFKKHPKVTVSTEVATTAEVINAVEKNLATFGVCDGIVPEHFEHYDLMSESYALYCGQSHPLFKQEDLKISDLRGEAYVAFTSDVLGGEHMGSVTAMRAQASIGQNVRASSCNVEEVCRMIINGVGIGVLPQHLADQHVQSNKLFQLPPYESLPEAEVRLLMNPHAKLNIAEKSLIKLITKELGEF